MGNPFTSPSIANYNSNPPSDDGTVAESNRVNWSKHKTKLTDPIKTLAESTVTNTNSAFAKVIGGGSVLAVNDDYTVLSGDQGKLIVQSVADKTITTPAAATVGSPFAFGVTNDSTGDMTVDGNASETINGSATVTIPSGKGGLLTTDGSNWFFFGQNFDPDLPRGYFNGLTTSNGTDADHDIDIAVGEARDFADSTNLSISTALTKQIDASWAAGTGAGGMATGVSLDINTWYHLFLVDLDAGGTDAGFDTSFTATNLLATTGVGTKYRYLWSVLTDGSSNILSYIQRGDWGFWGSVIQDVDTTSTTTAATHTLSVPPDISVLAKLNIVVNHGSATGLYLSSPDVADGAPTVATAVTTFVGSGNAGIQVDVQTNTSQQIRSRMTTAGRDLDFATVGWFYDRRG